MSEKKKDPIIKDYEKLKNEVVIDKVNEIFRTQPDNYIAALEEIGFEYHEEDDYEEIEERNARPENQNQKDLVAFFKGEKKLFDPDTEKRKIIDFLIAETKEGKETDSPVKI